MNAPSSAGSQSVSWSPRLCLQTPGTSCRPSQRPGRWLELFPPPASTTTKSTKVTKPTAEPPCCLQIRKHSEHNTLWILLNGSTVVRYWGKKAEIKRANTSKWHLHTFRCQTHSRGVCWIPSLCRWKWISFYLFCRLHRRISGGADSCAARPGKQQRPRHSLFTDFMSFWHQIPSVAVGIWLRCASEAPAKQHHSLLSWDRVSSLHKWRSVAPPLGSSVPLTSWCVSETVDHKEKVIIIFFKCSPGKLGQTKARRDSTINAKQCGKRSNPNVAIETGWFARV